MASGLIIAHLKLPLSCQLPSKHFFLSNPFANPPISVYPRTYNPSKLDPCLPRVSSTEGLPLEVIEESKFVPLNADDEKFGPPALLLLGFEADDVAKIQELLKDLDGEFLQIILCTEEMITGSLWQAMNTKQENLDTVKIARSLPQICFLSGLTGEEMMMLIDAFPDTGLAPPVFAALVPNSADKTVHELIEEVMGDHEMMKARDSS